MAQAQDRLSARRRFYGRWILANGWAEAVGLGTTLVLGWLAAPLLGETARPSIIILVALAAVLLGTLLEGVIVGLAQESVLRSVLARLPRWSWTLATAVGAGVAWLLGMIPSTLMALTGPPEPSSVTAEPGALERYAAAVVMGLVLGLVLGGVQWLVLRRHVGGAGRWPWANALAWALGMPLVFAGMELVPWSAGGVAIVSVMVTTAALVGLAVGAVHGRVLTHLLTAATRNAP